MDFLSEFALLIHVFVIYRALTPLCYHILCGIQTYCLTFHTHAQGRYALAPDAARALDAPLPLSFALSLPGTPVPLTPLRADDAYYYCGATASLDIDSDADAAQPLLLQPLQPHSNAPGYGWRHASEVARVACPAAVNRLLGPVALTTVQGSISNSSANPNSSSSVNSDFASSSSNSSSNSSSSSSSKIGRAHV